MKKNVGKTDRTIRFILGIAVIIAGLYFKNWSGLIGLVIMIPALLGSDPLYNIVGVDTNQGKQ